MFGDNLKLSHIVAVPQEHLRARLILNLSSHPGEGTPSVDKTRDRDVDPESLQFGCAFLRILQVVWEADSDKVPVRMSNLDMTDAYHRGTLRPSQVGDFTYIIPS